MKNKNKTSYYNWKNVSAKAEKEAEKSKHVAVVEDFIWFVARMNTCASTASN